MGLEFFRNLLDTSDFPARWRCGDWTAFHGYLHIVSDLLIWGAYTTIPCVLAFYIWRRKDVTFPRLFWLFCAFIFACGTTHLMEAVIFYYPAYRLAAIFKLVTAIVSWAAVFTLIRVAPQALRLPSLRRLNQELTQEIEARRRYEHQLSVSERRHRALVQMLANIIWETDAEGHIQKPQPDWEAFTGQTFTDYQGTGWLDAVHDDLRDQAKTAWAMSIARRAPFRFEGRIWHQESEDYRHVQLQATPLVNGDDSFIGYIGLATDDHEQWLADQRFRRALEAAPSAMIMFNRFGHLVLANQQAQELFGYSPAEFDQITVDELVPPRFRAQHAGHRSQYMHQPEAREMGKGRELYCLRKDGSEVPVEIGLTPIETTEGHMIVSSIVDITDRKKASEELEERARELARSNRDLDHFASIVSHDLREPLRMINSFSELLERDLDQHLTDRNRNWMRYIMEGAQRMDRLISDLLAYSRLKAKTMNLRPCSLQTIVSQAEDNLYEAIQESAAVIQTHDLPNVYADSPLMIQVFQNLIANAIRFRSEAPPWICIEAVPKGEMWQVSVRDNGIGMKPEDLDKIFEIFARLHSRKQYPGTGVGLAVCKKVIDLHGGHIWAESTPGEGACFHFTLPKAP